MRETIVRHSRSGRPLYHLATLRRFPAPWTVEKLDGGYKIIRRQRTVARLCLCVMPTRVMAVAKAATYISEKVQPEGPYP